MRFIRVTEENSLLLVGMSFFGDPFSNASTWSEENEIGALWNRFMRFYKDNSYAIKHAKHKDVMVEVHFEDEETNATGCFEVFVGVIVEAIQDIPLQCVAKQLPRTRYAVFTLAGEEIASDWGKQIYSEWLTSSEYTESHKYCMQYYDKRFKGVDEISKSELDVYVPVK